MERAALIGILAERIVGVTCPHPVRVAIDGVDGVGKTTFGNELSDAILLFDGVFLHRPELLLYWDLSLFLDARFEVTIPRAAARDGSSPDANAPENRRYVGGQQLYLQTCEPRRAATIVINNENLFSPEVVTAL
jgi:thymidylate kinase